MSTIRIHWRQTAAERYDTDVNKRAHAAIEATGVVLDGSAGGCCYAVNDPLPADESVWVLDPTEQELMAVGKALQGILGAPETLTFEVDE